MREFIQAEDYHQELGDRLLIQLVEPFFVFYTESVTHDPRFIPQSVFYTQSIMLSPPFIPESVFYTQSMFYTQSVVRSP